MFFKKKYTLSQVVDFIIKATHVKDYYNLVVIRTSDNTTFIISNKEPIGQDGTLR